MNSKLSKVIKIIFFLIIYSPSVAYAVYGGEGKPPTLSDFQTMAVSLIGTAYALIGTLFLGILVYNGIIYLIGYMEDAKYLLGASIEDAQKRMTQWMIGFIMVIISYPLVNSFMQGITGDHDCYEKLNNPTIQFIFPEVCKMQVTATPTPTGPTPTEDTP